MPKFFKRIPWILAAVLWAVPAWPQDQGGEVDRIIQARVTPPPGAKGIVCSGEFLCGSDVLPRFYRARGFRPAWLDGVKPGDQSEELIRTVSESWKEGLKPENYHLQRIREARDALAGQGDAPEPSRAADFDMLLTDAFLLYASNLASGLVNPETIEAEWFIKSTAVDLAEVLQKALELNEVRSSLEGLRPSHPEYVALERALEKYRGIRERGGWPSVPAGPALKPGAKGARVLALRQRLAASEDIDGGEAPGADVFDDALVTAVRDFQRRHGLDADGVAGPDTVAALNVPVDDRIDQIEANLERWRWLPHAFAPRQLVVNIAGFELSVLEGGEPVLKMPVIVGLHYAQTPVFDGRMTYIEINPYWNVPHKIASREILPLVKKDPGYLAQKGYRLFSGWSPDAAEVETSTVDWAKLSAWNFPYRIRQDAGPANALGRLAFMFPNKFDVYLHDTPQKELFSRAFRSFSHGCIRISKPMDLALYLLRGEPEWSEEKIQEAIEEGRNRIVRLSSPVPVFIVYLTAWPDQEGTVCFGADVYSRDPVLTGALEEKPPGKAVLSDKANSNGGTGKGSRDHQ